MYTPELFNSMKREQQREQNRDSLSGRFHHLYGISRRAIQKTNIDPGTVNSVRSRGMFQYVAKEEIGSKYSMVGR